MIKFFTAVIILLFPIYLYPQGSQLDITFGEGGKVTTNIIPSYSEWGNSTIIQPDGKIIVAGFAYNGSNSNANFNIVRYNDDGTLDKTFGFRGRVTIDFNISNDITSGGSCVALQSDGKIVIAGYTYGSGGGFDVDFAVARYNSDGTIDSSFGVAGEVTTDFGSSSDYGYTVAVQENGKIVVGGFAYDGTDQGFAMARYNSDGTLDLTFNTDGKVINNFGNAVNDLTIQNDGKILATGPLSNGANFDFAVTRYNSDGSLDGTFGTGGVVATDFGETDWPNSIALQSDEKIIAAGYSYNGSNYDFALVRYNSDGTPDLDFGSNSKIRTDIIANDNDYGFSTAVQQDGKIIVAGYSGSGPTDFSIVRYNDDGTFDQSFGSGGIALVGFEDGEAFSAALQSDSKIILSGRASVNSLGSDFAAVRFNDNGTLDNSFGIDGKVTTDLGNSGDIGTAVAIQTDGKILVTGYSAISGIHSNMALARYNSDGTIDTSLSASGRVINDMGDISLGNSIAVLSDNKILVAGYYNNGADNDFLVSRFNPNGTLDNTFPGGGNYTLNIAGSNDYANSVAIQSNGKMLIGGYSFLAATNNDFTIVRINTDGSLDMSFDNVDLDGVVRTDLNSNSNDQLNSLAVQEDGKIIAAGSSNNGVNNDYAIVRHNSNGSLDNTFGSNGIVRTDFESSEDFGSTVLIQPDDGKIIIAGFSYINSIYQLTLARYNSDGSLDDTFGTNGKVITNLGTSIALKSSAILQADGKIVAGRNFNNNGNFDFALVRYNPDGTLDNTFGTDGIAVIDFERGLDVNFALAVQTDGKLIAAGTSSDGFSLDFALARYNALFPIVSYSLDELVFGNIKVDSSSSKNFFIRNTGSAPFVVDSIIHRNNSFTVNPENLTIPQNDSVEVTVTFTPGTASAFNDTLLIYSNASVHPDTITLSGTGTSETTAPIIALSAGTINFPDITINSSISRSIYIKNNGNAPLVINSITSDNSEFTVDSTNF
ncbi:MAG: DUF1573 domain-containing protein, partial [Ignavibacteria bacterium]